MPARGNNLSGIRNEFYVYLAGPITGCTYGESIDWRAYVSDRLPPWIRGVSPLRGKRYLEGEGKIADSYEEHPLSCAKGIITRDRWDAMNRDMLFANLLETEKISIGTIMEIAWADAARKPIVICMREGNPHWHAMVREAAGFVVPDLDMGIEIIKTLLTPTDDGEAVLAHLFAAPKVLSNL